ncbi:hypothetical protein [Pseudonocardia sp. GCM10023141]|uniref:hypothetical protein n=1 Tax=Pseudonocardia sp. GCM10023141 TaxID=3252653 RepID=UPI003619622B
MHATVIEIGAAGARLATSAGLGLEPGLVLSFTVTLPFTGAHEVAATVERMVAAPRGINVVDVRWAPPPRAFLLAIAVYLLLTDRALTPVRLRAAGLPVRPVERALTYGRAELDELGAIHDLRLRAHQHEGRLDGLRAADLASPFDAYSCHLVCRHGTRIVGYARLIEVDGDPARSQYVAWGGHEVPPWMWRAGFVEGGAGAVDPDFQRAGLFLPLLQHLVRVAVESGHRYVLGGCEDDLLEMYVECGYQLLETRQVEPRPGWSFRSHLIHLDIDALVAGKLAGRDVEAMAEAARFALRRLAAA